MFDKEQLINSIGSVDSDGNDDSLHQKDQATNVRRSAINPSNPALEFEFEEIELKDIPYKCTIESFCHAEFKEILQMDGISQDDIIKSLEVTMNRRKVFEAGESSGASGSFFFFSFDNKLLLKTILKEESKTLRDMIMDYIEHLKVTGNQSLLARIYGIFRVRSPYFAPLEIMVMQNTAQVLR